MANVTLRLPAELLARLPKLTQTQRSSGARLSGMMLIAGDSATGKPQIIDAVVVGPKRAGTLARKASIVSSSANGRAIHAVTFDIVESPTAGGSYQRSDWLFGSIAQMLPPASLWEAIRRNQMLTRLYPFAAESSERAESVALGLARDQWDAAGGKDAAWSSGESVAIVKPKEKVK